MKVIWAYRCLQCHKLLHPTQVLDKGWFIPGDPAHSTGGYFETLPRHKLFVQEGLDAPIQEFWHAVLPEWRNQ